MAKRTWRAWPDTVYTYEDVDGVPVEIPFVSRDRFLEAVLDGVSMLDRTGGALIVTVGRQNTDMPGEALTTSVAVQWQDGPKLKPEAPVELPVPDVRPVEAEPQPEPVAVAVGDGLDDPVEDEDVSAIPESLR